MPVSQKIKNIFISLALMLILALIGKLLFSSETEEEREQKNLNKYIKGVSVEDAVGQILMVGSTADINTVSESVDLNEEISNIGVGAIFVFASNYYDSKALSDSDYLQKIIEYNNTVQDKTLKSNLKLPIILAADFEGYGYAPLKRAQLLSPSSLAMGAAKDGNLIEKMGGYIGLEMESLGIHAIFGPVLDSYNINQGGDTILQDRSFAGNTKGVIATASHFVKGLNRSNTLVIAKHFPSYGGVDINPHSISVPKYDASFNKMEDDLTPFTYLSKHLDGVMTSHVTVSQLDDQIATFSEPLLRKFLQVKELNALLRITDDLSEMGSVRKYMTDHSKSYADIAIEAFDAGHDMLLFAHCVHKMQNNIKRDDPKGRFTIRDLKSVKEGLVQHINGNSSREGQLRGSLKKILELKLKIAKSKKWTLEQLIDHKVSEAAFLTKASGSSVLSEIGRKFDSTFHLPQDNENASSLSTSLATEILRKAATEIQNKNQIQMLNNRDSSERIIFASYADGLPLFRNNFAPKFKNAEFLEIPLIKDGHAFDVLENKIFTDIKTADLLVYTAYDKSDADLLKRLLQRSPQYSRKTYIFALNNPGIFEDEVLKEMSIIDLYSKHPLSYVIANDVLSGQMNPEKLSNSPVSLGNNGDFYNLATTNWIAPAAMKDIPDLYKSEELRSCLPPVQNEFITIKKTNELLIRWLVFTFTLMVLLHFLRKYTVKSNTQNVYLSLLTGKREYIFAQIVIFSVITYFAIFGNTQILKTMTGAKEIKQSIEWIYKVN